MASVGGDVVERASSPRKDVDKRFEAGSRGRHFGLCFIQALREFLLLSLISLYHPHQAADRKQERWCGDDSREQHRAARYACPSSGGQGPTAKEG